MCPKLGREELRERLRALTDVQRRLVLERAVEHLPDSALGTLLEGIVGLDECRAEDRAQPSLGERVDSHVAATRRGAFRGEYLLRNRHGQREPWQTAAWIATTSHLFDLALKGSVARAAAAGHLLSLLGLVEEVDDRPDEFVVFEDSSAAEELASELAEAERLARRPRREVP
jgi:hypothetical protein